MGKRYFFPVDFVVLCGCFLNICHRAAFLLFFLLFCHFCFSTVQYSQLLLFLPKNNKHKRIAGVCCLNLYNNEPASVTVCSVSCLNFQLMQFYFIYPYCLSLQWLSVSCVSVSEFVSQPASLHWCLRWGVCLSVPDCLSHGLAVVAVADIVADDSKERQTDCVVIVLMRSECIHSCDY